MIKEDILELKMINEVVESLFSNLPLSTLNTKTDSNSWSIAQCLDHLIVSNSKYFPVLEALKSPKYKMTFWERNNPFTASTGKQMIKNLGPVISKKYQAPKLFLPGKSTLKASILSDFLDHHNKLISILEKISPEQYTRNVITSPVAGLITLKVSDAIQVIIVHEKRHLEQMKRVLNSIQ